MVPKVLVIDDTETVRDGIVTLLRYADFEALAAENGEAGLVLARQWLPDIIICDILMPGMDGHEVLARLHQDETTGTIPVIFLTAKSSRDDLRKGMDLGADDYLTKPYTAEELLSAVRTRLERRALTASVGERKLQQLRRSIIDNLPHEMLTPLTGVIGYGELLRDGAAETTPAEIEHMAGRIVECGNRLHRLIKNFLIFARIEAYASDPALRAGLLTHRTNDATEVVIRAARRIVDANRRAQDLVIEGESCDVQMPQDYLTKIVEELVDNACKFSRPGSPVSLRTRVCDTFRLEIRDEGRGMSPQEVANVEAYAQFERPLYEQQGMGLGLVIAKRLAEVHGGSLTIDSEHDKGTTVRVSLQRLD